MALVVAVMVASVSAAWVGCASHPRYVLPEADAEANAEHAAVAPEAEVVAPEAAGGVAREPREPREPGEPRWYREVPNWPGVKLYGAGAASVPGRARLAEAVAQAEAAARRQLRGRVRALFAHTVAELLREQGEIAPGARAQDEAPPDPAQLVADALLGAPGEPVLRRDRLDALIEPALPPVIAEHEQGPLVTVYRLHTLDVHRVLDVLHTGLMRLSRRQPLRGARTAQQAAEQVRQASREVVFATLVHRQVALYGSGVTASGTSGASGAGLPAQAGAGSLPAWTQRVPSRPGEAVFGLGRASSRALADGGAEAGRLPRAPAELGRVLSRVQDVADREARLHLRESLWLTLAWMLDEPLEVHLAAAAADVSPYARLRWVRSLSRIVASLAAFAAEPERVVEAPRPDEPGDEVRAYTLMRLDLDDVMVLLARELARAQPPTTLDGTLAEPWRPSPRDLRTWWLQATDTGNGVSSGSDGSGGGSGYGSVGDGSRGSGSEPRLLDH